ncbi:MAG TPA: hypothetical protein VF045_04270 [Acidimicrobiales bacterium]
MSWQRTSTTGTVPADPVGEAVAAAIVEILEGSSVEILYFRDGESPSLPAVEAGSSATATATGEGPPGWQVAMTVRLGGAIAPLVTSGNTPLLEILGALPGAGMRAAARYRSMPDAPVGGTLPPAIQRALRDTVVIEALSQHHVCPDRVNGLIAEALEFLIELNGTRVEAQDLTHGVVITNAMPDTPRLRFAYPSDVRTAKRAPLLFDGQRSVLVVDWAGNARTEVQRHRRNHHIPGAPPLAEEAAEFTGSGSLVAEATRSLGGIGLFLRKDRTIWVFADGEPLLMRRGEHWTAFPLELAAAIATAIEGTAVAADIAVDAAFIISAQRHGAILAIVEDPASLEGVVSPKDRYDLRNDFDPMGMRAETKLHHLIDAEELDAQTLARLAALDGATILDRDAKLLAYGAIVTSSASEHEGARTAAAKTLSLTAEIVLKVSADGGITVFRDGKVVATLLG